MIQKSSSVRYITQLALFCAVALILSYVESFVPFQLGVPGAKIGLANVVSIICLFCFGFKEAFMIMFLRVFIVGITFTNFYMMLYSLAGGTLSICVMALLYKTNLFSKTVISIMGGIFHNVGQLIVAMLFFQTTTFMYYLPYLILLGLVSGCGIGLIGQLIYIKIGKYLIKNSI